MTIKDNQLLLLLLLKEDNVRRYSSNQIFRNFFLGISVPFDFSPIIYQSLRWMICFLEIKPFPDFLDIFPRTFSVVYSLSLEVLVEIMERTLNYHCGNITSHGVCGSLIPDIMITIIIIIWFNHHSNLGTHADSVSELTVGFHVFHPSKCSTFWAFGISSDQLFNTVSGRQKFIHWFEVINFISSLVRNGKMRTLH